MKTRLRFSASVKAGKARRLHVIGYTGNVMVVSGFGPIVLDLARMEIPSSVPCLCDHENSVAAVAGSAIPKIVDGRELHFDVNLADSDAAADVVRLLESGAELQASVGCESLESSYVEEGQTINVNGA